MPKTAGTALLFWLLGFFGLAGMHRIYLGFWATGLLWFVTLGFLWIGQIIDLFRLRSLVELSNDQFADAVRSSLQTKTPRR